MPYDTIFGTLRDPSREFPFLVWVLPISNVSAVLVAVTGTSDSSSGGGNGNGSSFDSAGGKGVQRSCVQQPMAPC